MSMNKHSTAALFAAMSMTALASFPAMAQTTKAQPLCNDLNSIVNGMYSVFLNNAADSCESLIGVYCLPSEEGFDGTWCNINFYNWQGDAMHIVIDYSTNNMCGDYTAQQIQAALENQIEAESGCGKPPMATPQ